MTTDLATVLGRVRVVLRDSGSGEYTDAELTEVVSLALDEVSGVAPVLSAAVLDAVDDQWEYSLSALTGLCDVVEVWYPYLASDPAFCAPRTVPWRLLGDTVLCLDESVAPCADYDIRVVYGVGRTLGGLGGATATTVPSELMGFLVRGCAGMAVLVRAQSEVDVVSVGRDVVRRWVEWATAALRMFHDALADYAVRHGGGGVVCWG